MIPKYPFDRRLRGPGTQKCYGGKSLPPAGNRCQIPLLPTSKSNHYTDEVYCGDVAQIRINDKQCEICGCCHSSVDQDSSCVGCDAVAATGCRSLKTASLSYGILSG